MGRSGERGGPDLRLSRPSCGAPLPLFVRVGTYFVGKLNIYPNSCLLKPFGGGDPWTLSVSRGQALIWNVEHGAAEREKRAAERSKGAAGEVPKTVATEQKSHLDKILDQLDRIHRRA